MRSIRYNIVEKVLDIPLQNPQYPGFKIGGYKTNFATWIAEHAVVYHPSLDNLGECPLVRINSACFTGDIFGDRRCDCTKQLYGAMDLIKTNPGLIIYHFHHEGRGLGLTSKLMTYKRMSEEGISTFKAMEDLSNRNDLRTYGSSILILHDLGIRKLKLITNNVSLRQYLTTKKEEQGHSIDFDMIDIKQDNGEIAE